MLTTDLSAGDLRDTLRQLYSGIFVETLTKNPLWNSDEPITCPAFTAALERFVGGLTH